MKWLDDNVWAFCSYLNFISFEKYAFFIVVFQMKTLYSVWLAIYLQTSPTKAQRAKKKTLHKKSKQNTLTFVFYQPIIAVFVLCIVFLISTFIVIIAFFVFGLDSTICIRLQLERTIFLRNMNNSFMIKKNPG